MIPQKRRTAEMDAKRIAQVLRWHGKVRLTFDDESALSLPASLFEILQLREGDEFLPSALREARQQAVALCFLKCCRSLSARFRTTAEMTRRLRDSAWPEDVIQETIALLLDSGYLDDARYAEAYTARRQAQGYGSRRIRAELLQKGVPREILEKCTPAEESAPANDTALKKALRRAANGRDLTNPREFQKAVASLIRKGFSFSQAKEAVEGMRQEENEDN